MSPDQEKLLTDIHTAIIGNESLGQEGIIPRLKAVEKYQQKDKLYKAKVAGGVLVGVPLLSEFWHWLTK